MDGQVVEAGGNLHTCATRRQRSPSVSRPVAGVPADEPKHEVSSGWAVAPFVIVDYLDTPVVQ
jgi:hypothetical protein